jgi:hypothetical protein
LWYAVVSLKPLVRELSEGRGGMASTSSTTPPSSSSVFPRVRQRTNWDCGLACAEMVLRASDAPPSVVGFESLERDIGEDLSVWTADVAAALCRRGLGRGLVYHTTLAGVNPAHGELDFYRGEFDSDVVRVPALFTEAEGFGMVVREVRCRRGWAGAVWG